MLKVLTSHKYANVSLLPALVVTVALLLLPALIVATESLSSGWIAYNHAITDQQFAESLELSLWYTAITVPIQLLLGVGAAVIIHQFGVSSRTLIVILFAPYAVPSVVAVLAWKFLIEDHGLYAFLASSLISIPNFAWKNDLVFWSLCLISVWQFYPFVFVSVLARLRRIPTSLYRTAQLDGAGLWQQFLIVTYPGIRSIILAVIIVRVAFMFTKFDTAWLLAGKTVVDGVRLLPIHIYLTSWFGNASQGSATSILSGISLALLLAIISSLVFLFTKLRKV